MGGGTIGTTEFPGKSHGDPTDDGIRKRLVLLLSLQAQCQNAKQAQYQNAKVTPKRGTAKVAICSR
jgi:hypothetical protein